MTTKIPRYRVEMEAIFIGNPDIAKRSFRIFDLVEEKFLDIHNVTKATLVHEPTGLTRLTLEIIGVTTCDRKVQE